MITPRRVTLLLTLMTLSAPSDSLLPSDINDTFWSLRHLLLSSSIMTPSGLFFTFCYLLTLMMVLRVLRVTFSINDGSEGPGGSLLPLSVINDGPGGSLLPLFVTFSQKEGPGGSLSSPSLRRRVSEGSLLPLSSPSD